MYRGNLTILSKRSPQTVYPQSPTIFHQSNQTKKLVIPYSQPNKKMVTPNQLVGDTLIPQPYPPNLTHPKGKSYSTSAFFHWHLF